MVTKVSAPGALVRWRGGLLPARSLRQYSPPARGSRNNGTKTHAKPRPRSVSWWLLALKEQSPGGSVRDLSLSRFVLSPFRLSHDPIAECPPGSPAQRVVR